MRCEHHLRTKNSTEKFLLASGIADLVKTAVRRGLSRFTGHPTSYDSDVFRYTQLSQQAGGGLYAGKEKRDKRLLTEFKSLFDEDNVDRFRSIQSHLSIFLGESCRLSATMSVRRKEDGIGKEGKEE